MLQENIKKIEEYFKGIEINDGMTVVRVLFKEKWGVYPSKDERIKVVNSKDNPNEWMYYAKYDEVEMDEIFELISETIKMNVEAGLKIELLTQKFEELKNIFSSESLERLNTLEFIFTDKFAIKPKKRKYVRKNKNVEIENGEATAIETENNENKDE